MVAVTYNEGVLLCEEYDKLRRHLQNNRGKELRMFQRAKNASRLWIQDGDPSQNSAVARRSLKKMNAQLISIPPRSPDVNPIENIFHIVKKKLDDDALRRRIHREDYSAFRDRVRQTIFDPPKNVINKTIESMEDRERSPFEILKEQMDMYKSDCAQRTRSWLSHYNKSSWNAQKLEHIAINGTYIFFIVFRGDTVQ